MTIPIDPGDVAELTRAFVAGVRANLDDPMAGVVAVARAVCPEHHAVYDTRLMVAVPVAELERIDNALHELLDISAGLHSAVMHDGDTDHREHWLNEFDTKHDGFHAVWERVFDLLPNEATDEA